MLKMIVLRIRDQNTDFEDVENDSFKNMFEISNMNQNLNGK